MSFNPAIHTIDYLLKDLDLTRSLARHSELFCKSLAQDVEFLKSVFRLNPSYSGNILAILADNSDWAATPAAQNKEIISLKYSSGRTVAHDLATSEEWALTPAAQDQYVLMLMPSSSSNQSKFGVVHTLAKNEAWAQTPASQDIKTISCESHNMNGHTAAHILAKYNETWWSTPAAHKKEVLKLTTSTDKRSVYEVRYHSLNSDNEKAVLIMRLISLGEAVTFVKTPQVTDSTITAIMGLFSNEIDCITDQDCKFQVLAAAYSSLCHLSSFNDVIAVCRSIPLHISNLEQRLLAVQNKTVLDKFHTRTNDGCDVCRELLTKQSNERIFGARSEQSPSNNSDITLAVY